MKQTKEMRKKLGNAPNFSTRMSSTGGNWNQKAISTMESTRQNYRDLYGETSQYQSVHGGNNKVLPSITTD